MKKIFFLFTMKKAIFLILMLLFTCSLSGCIGMASSAPVSVKYENQEYKTGFYGDLFPANINFDGDKLKISGQTFQKVKSNEHNWIHSYIGNESEGTIYCIYNDWENEKKFYSNPVNFNFYCGFGNVFYPDLIIKLDHIEYGRFDELMTFAYQHEYDPFNANADKDQAKYPMPESTDDEIHFYKESKDGFFVSSKANAFYVINDQLVLLYYYDFAHGDEGKECMYGVEVPDDIAKYFIDYITDISR